MASERDWKALIVVLQAAYSGERAAAYAYRGHWKSLGCFEERCAVHTIEEEEWRHRGLVGEMLNQLGSHPDRIREYRSWLIGRILGILCGISGRFLPMYAAGKLESRNIQEYANAARLARCCGFEGFVESLLVMAEVEWEHESYFRSRVVQHPFGRLIRLWPQPQAKESLREGYRDIR